mmetsp:Transcript_5917/g.15085  ORF Transcript_5917/g.15085 Transcript_5917/m.15085 type:complete len:250 (-) Transcript_5917:1-750(-)
MPVRLVVNHFGRHPAVGTCFCGVALFPSHKQPCNAEITDLDFTPLGHEDVLGLQVSVDDVLRGEVHHAPSNCQGIVHKFGKFWFGLDQMVANVPTFHVLVHDADVGLLRASPNEVDDVFVLDLGQEGNLLHELLHVVKFLRRITGNVLGSNDLTLIHALEYFAEGASPYHLFDMYRFRIQLPLLRVHVADPEIVLPQVQERGPDSLQRGSCPPLFFFALVYPIGSEPMETIRYLIIAPLHPHAMEQAWL